MFLPASGKEAAKLGWDKLDIILITGDAYIDSPFSGVSVIGKALANAGYRVGIIAQPDTGSGNDITRLGEPELFWGVTGGCVDSMVANYTALKKKRRKDDFTPGGENIKRPDRAVIVYSNLIRKYFKDTKPVVLGGVEASLRRIAHYDFWSNKVRRSVLFDAKADIIIYGMGEKAVVKLADSLKNGKSIKKQKGICYISDRPAGEYINLPSFEEAKSSKTKFEKMFDLFYKNCDPLTAKGLNQRQDTRYLIQNPPEDYLTQQEMDEVYGLNYERDAHLLDKQQGRIKALETIRFSISSHRGCYGECNFCSIAVHQGRVIRERSERSILKEAKKLTQLPGFKGYILDVGGPTANMYGFECKKKQKKGPCPEKRCLFPEVCKTIKVSHKKQISVLQKIRNLKGVKGVFIASGVRHDLVLKDSEYGGIYLEELIKHHVSGQLKIAPEHISDRVLKQMGKPGQKSLLEFKKRFENITKKSKKKQFLTYYLIAAHPGCDLNDMFDLKNFAAQELKLFPEQVQIFTPTPSTYSTLMYHTGRDPFSGKKVFVEKDPRKKERQKFAVVKTGDRKRKKEN